MTIVRRDCPNYINNILLQPEDINTSYKIFIANKIIAN